MIRLRDMEQTTGALEGVFILRVTNETRHYLEQVSVPLILGKMVSEKEGRPEAVPPIKSSMSPKELEGRKWKPQPSKSDGLNPETHLPEWLLEEKVLKYDVNEYDWTSLIREGLAELDLTVDDTRAGTSHEVQSLADLHLTRAGNQIFSQSSICFDVMGFASIYVMISQS